MEILMSDDILGALHSILQVRPPDEVPSLVSSALSATSPLAVGIDWRASSVQGSGTGLQVLRPEPVRRKDLPMKMRTALMLAAMVAVVYAQAAPPPGQEGKPATGLYQRQPGAHLYEQKGDFFHASAKLVNPKNVDYGSMLEQLRKALLDASVTNSFFWCSVLTTALLMVLMLAYGVRVMDEKRTWWRAAKILTDVWNGGEYERSIALSAIERFNAHMQDCNRVIATQRAAQSGCRGSRGRPEGIGASPLRVSQG
jgi:hypothetical protein